MKSQDDDTLVAVDRFIEATRDSGYKGTPSAIAELVDNAIQARATSVVVSIEPDHRGSEGLLRVEVTDNGEGMDSVTLHQALRFGGSTRFNDRKGLGRYGMGLPNSSLSQARRLEVCTWRSASSAVATYLDVDEIATGTVTRVPKPTRAIRPATALDRGFDCGTTVVWTRCDRLDHRRPTTIAKKLRSFLGRVFRYFLWGGVSIEVNGELVQPIDPLVSPRAIGYSWRSAVWDTLGVRHQATVTGWARRRRGPRSSHIHRTAGGGVASSRERGEAPPRISKAAGISVVRAQREIEYGWFFMGDKRKENYDDWWRCEIGLTPVSMSCSASHTRSSRSAPQASCSGPLFRTSRRRRRP